METSVSKNSSELISFGHQENLIVRVKSDMAPALAGFVKALDTKGSQSQGKFLFGRPTNRIHTTIVDCGPLTEMADIQKAITSRVVSDLGGVPIPHDAQNLTELVTTSQKEKGFSHLTVVLTNTDALEPHMQFEALQFVVRDLSSKKGVNSIVFHEQNLTTIQEVEGKTMQFLELEKVARIIDLTK